MRGTLNGLLLLLSGIFVLTACEDDILPPVESKNEQALLQNQIWENEIEIDQLFTDNNSSVKYIKRSTLTFTKTQYTHTIQHISPSNSSHAAGRQPEEYWGDYQYTEKDSLLTLRYTVVSEPADDQADADRAQVVHARYKVLQVKDDQLVLKAIADSSAALEHPETTFKPQRRQ